MLEKQMVIHEVGIVKSLGKFPFWISNHVAQDSWNENGVPAKVNLHIPPRPVG